MTKLQIRDRNGNWHDLLSERHYIGGRGWVITYRIAGTEIGYELPAIAKFKADGTVREKLFETTENTALRISQRQMPGVPA